MTDLKEKSDFPLSENYSEVDLQENDGQEMGKIGLLWDIIRKIVVIANFVRITI